MSQMTFGESFEDSPKKTSLKGVMPENSWYKDRTLSHSSVSTFQTCPQKWKFRYVDKIPQKPKSYFSFGKSVHSGLEFLFENKGGRVPTLDETLDQFKASWISEGYESPAQESWFFREGERIIRGFYAKHQKEGKNVLEVELHFTIDIDGVPVTGFIDRVDSTADGGLRIIDYKTGKAFDRSRVRTDPQLTLYQIACRSLLKKPVESLTLYHLNSLTPITTASHTKTQEENLRKGIVEAARGVMEKNFEPKPDEKGHCRWCDYLQICPAFIGREKPGRLDKAARAILGEEIDRLGKLNDRIQKLSEEKRALEKSIVAGLEARDPKEAEGELFRATLADDGIRTSLKPEEKS